MPWQRNGQAAWTAAGLLLIGLGLGLAGCGSSSSLTTQIFGPSYNANNFGLSAAGVNDTTASEEVPCPSVSLRTGASTLIIGSKPGPGEPAPLDVRYQASVVNMARECHLNAGLLTIKVGIEGRVIMGPAGAPGTIEVPLRIAVVREGVSPVTIVTKFTVLPVAIAPGADRANFIHIEPELAFPMPQPASVIDNYIVYVGFDPLAGKPQKKAPPRRPKQRLKPKPPQPTG